MITYDFNVNGDAVEISTAEEPSAEKTSNSKKQKRSRRFCLTSYVAPEEIRSFLSRAPWVQHWAMCTHDRDINDDGTPKVTHTHIILYTYDAKTASGIKKIFDRFSSEFYFGIGEAQNTLVQVCNDVVSQWAYLIHKYDKDKAQYDTNERYCDDSVYWNELCKTNALNDGATNTALAMMDDLANGTPTRTMVARYGKDYLYHSNYVKQGVIDMIAEDMRSYENSETLSRQAVQNISSTALDLVRAVGGSYTDEQISLFKTMLLHSMNNISVLEGYTIQIVKE